MVAIRMPAALIAEIDAWGATNDAMRSEAVRRLVEAGLKPHAFCLSDKMAAAINAWVKENEPGLNLHDAMSRLVELGLRAKAKS